MKTCFIVRALVIGVLSFTPCVIHAHTLSIATATIEFQDTGGYEVRLNCEIASYLADAPAGGITEEKARELLSWTPSIWNEKFAAAEARFRSEVGAQVDGLRDEAATVEFPSMDAVRGAVINFLSPSGNYSNLPVKIQGRLSAPSLEMSIQFPKDVGAVLMTISTPGQEPVRQLLLPGEQSRPMALSGLSAAPAMKEPSRAEVAVRYLIFGFEHIVPKGRDHILFVLGLFLLSPRLKPLFIQVTAFTVAHSISLALSLYQIISLPSRIVEPLIALSIVFVAVENIVTNRLHAWRPLIVFGFGLIHGLGFAGVLTELGLPRHEFVTALVTFNAGVELGQLAVIGLAFVAVGWCFRRDWYRARVAVPASIVIAAAGLFWTVQRILL